MYSPRERTHMPDPLAAIRTSLEEARDLEAEIRDVEADLARRKSRFFELQHQVLPDQFNAAGISSLTLDADGNKPSVKCDLRPYFKAVIPAKWGPERRAEALAELDRFDAGDLAKRIVTVAFPRSDSNGVAVLAAQLEDLGYACSVQFDIPWQTLTSWLREAIGRGQTPDLDKIGGQVGQIVNMKKIEE